MNYVLVSAERNTRNKANLSDALIVMHECEKQFDIDSSATPFTVSSTSKITTISIDDSYPKFDEIVDTFANYLNTRRAKREAEQAAILERKAHKKALRKNNLLNERLAMVFKLLDKQDNEVLFKEKGESITISIKGRHSYNVDQMRKLCNLFVKFDPTFTCQDNHFVITIKVK